MDNKISILNLSKNEQKVFKSIARGKDTPLLVSQHTKISRATVYITMKSLEKRGLLENSGDAGRKMWNVVSKKDIATRIMYAKQYLLGCTASLHHDFLYDDVEVENEHEVLFFKGKDALMTLLHEVFKTHVSEKYYALQGSRSIQGWSKIFSMEEINDINFHIKKNDIIVHSIVEKGIFEQAYAALGIDWARELGERTASVNEVDKKYLDFPSEIWIFKNSMYLIDFDSVMVIEIKNKGLVKMLRSVFDFFKDHSEKIDINSIVRHHISTHG